MLRELIEETRKKVQELEEEQRKNPEFSRLCDIVKLENMLQNLEIIEETGALDDLREKDLDMLKKCGSKLGSTLCGILRHHPDGIGVTMYKQGWVKVNELIEKFNTFYCNKRYYLTLPVLMEVVRTDNKQRYGLKGQLPDLMIRCRQGHSIPWIEMDYRQVTPPDVLYHGTIRNVLDPIMKEGLRPMGRQKVHLSVDVPTAQNVANRRSSQGKTIILQVAAGEAAKDGVIFYLSDNCVCLADHVPPKYLSLHRVYV